MIQSPKSRRASRDPSQILKRLIQILAKDVERPLRWRQARNELAALIRPRKGEIQVIGTKPRSQMVLISAQDLCELLARLSGERSFIDELRAMPGYDPPARRLVFSERLHSRESPAGSNQKSRRSKE
jgi:hypothetical protein